MKKDERIVNRVVEKIMKDFDFEIDDILDTDKEEIEQAVKDEVFENLDEMPPAVDWIEMVELDEAETHKNKNGDFLSN